MIVLTSWQKCIKNVRFEMMRHGTFVNLTRSLDMLFVEPCRRNIASITRLLYLVRLITHNKNLSASPFGFGSLDSTGTAKTPTSSPRPRVSVSVLTMGLSPNLILVV
ncbi:hypothetical protein [Nostoc linckia]|uniref:hypothetical protein n=1 Tax=Nostoc linckia TaxID=92942 RepID=UPI0011812EE2|nr:hypothetical protein [Nostoc linckia]